MNLKIKKLTANAIIPQYATIGAACFDLHVIDSGAVAARSSKVFRTGLSFEIPVGHVMMVYSRSGHGFKSNVRLANGTGVIDSDYRGEVMVKLTSDDNEGTLWINEGDRVCQAMIIPVTQVTFEVVDELSTTDRGEAGLGSTGVK